MRKRMNRSINASSRLSVILLLLAGCAHTATMPPADDAHPAARFRAGGEPAVAAPDGSFFLEAEEFQIVTPGWQSKAWGENYYAATFANTFLSRKAFLGAPEQGSETIAVMDVDIQEAGQYLVLARYEAAYRFETRFRIKIEQGRKTVFDRMYGARDNLKIWAFGQRLKTELAWGWGAVENVVWEGYLGEGNNHYAGLTPGPARVSLIAGPQPEPGARRNVDLILLTTDEVEVKHRVEREGYLPLDGWLTQAGDVWMRVINTGDKAVSARTGRWQEHSPYWVHLRRWQPVSASADPGETSAWVDVGGTMDALNDGQWAIQVSGPATVVFGLRDAAGEIEIIKTVETEGGVLNLAGHADTRYSRKLRTQEEVLYDLMDYLREVPVNGRVPTETMIFGYTFGKGSFGAAYDAVVDEFIDMFGLRLTAQQNGYVDWRKQGPEQLAASSQKLSATQREQIRVVSLGDEIGLPAPAGAAATDGFIAYLKAQGLNPDQVDAAADGDWDNITYSLSADLKESKPGIFYWSRRYRHYYGIQGMKGLTDVLRRNLPNAHIGANFSPHHGGYRHSYLPEVFQWVSCFRQDGMTLPWSEDYIWQVPVGTPQMNGILLDMFRAANRGRPDREILYYVMPHKPGNTPAMWRRLFHNALGHGMTIVNLFEFRPVWAAYTENHVTGNAMYGTIKQTFHELGSYEDIVQAGRVRPARTALWFSETADIWDNNRDSLAAAKRALYVAIQGQQAPLDFLVEDDAQNGTLDDYRVIYLADANVSQAASRQLAAWVENGGTLFATAGAGLFDEYNRPNAILRDMLGVTPGELQVPGDQQVGFIKQDIRFIEPVARVSLTESAAGMPAYGITAPFQAADDATVLGVFDDQSPAVISRRVGEGTVFYCGFLPGLSYFAPAIPLKPTDRGSTDDAMAHFIPTAFDAAAGALIGRPLTGLMHPVEADHPLVETSIIESDKGTLIVLGNWSGEAIEGLTLRVNIPVPASATMATGTTVERVSDGETTLFTFDMDVSGDVLILR